MVQVESRKPVGCTYRSRLGSKNSRYSTCIFGGGGPFINRVRRGTRMRIGTNNKK